MSALPIEVDDIQGFLTNTSLRRASEDDDWSYLTWLRDKKLADRELDLKADTLHDLHKQGGKHLSDESDLASFSDLAHATSMGKADINFGHWGNYYKQGRAHYRDKENFANLHTLLSSDDETVKLLRKLHPEQAELYESQMKQFLEMNIKLDGADVAF